MRSAVLLAIGIGVVSQASISAAPVGHYNPATGGISFTNLTDVFVIELYANGIQLAKENAAGPVNPVMLALSSNGIAWGTHSNPIGADFFGGNLHPSNMQLKNADIFWFDSQRVYAAGTIVQVPEPAPLMLALAAFAGMARLGRRAVK